MGSIVAPERIWVDNEGLDSTFWNDNGDAIGTTEYIRADAADAAITAEREAERERCCRAICFMCFDRYKYQAAGPIEGSQRQWHKLHDGTVVGPCDAAAIRREVKDGK